MTCVRVLGLIKTNGVNCTWGEFICPVCEESILRPVHRGRSMKRCPRCSKIYHDLSIKKHGEHSTRLYRTWTNMKSRCNNPSQNNYPRYGGRGIKVCEEWGDFKTFSLWAHANGYTDELTIDRINVDGGYRPDNCRWVTINVNVTKDKLKLTKNDCDVIGRRLLAGEVLADICIDYEISPVTYHRALRRYNPVGI